MRPVPECYTGEGLTPARAGLGAPGSLSAPILRRRGSGDGPPLPDLGEVADTPRIVGLPRRAGVLGEVVENNSVAGKRVLQEDPVFRVAPPRFKSDDLPGQGRPEPEAFRLDVVSDLQVGIGGPVALGALTRLFPSLEVKNPVAGTVRVEAAVALAQAPPIEEPVVRAEGALGNKNGESPPEDPLPAVLWAGSQGTWGRV